LSRKDLSGKQEFDNSISIQAMRKKLLGNDKIESRYAYEQRDKDKSARGAA
jgi:hypothetical protein